VLAGVVRFIKVKKLIAKSRENIGHSSTEFIRMVRGTADVGDED
jgi:hypothetical protein